MRASGRAARVWRRRAAVLTALFLLSGRAAGQAPERPAGSETKAEASLPVPRKPFVHQYRVGAEATALAWDSEAPTDDNLLLNLDVERDLASFLAARAALAYGTTEQRPLAGGGGPAGVRLYLPELSLLLQHALMLSTQHALTPYALAGFGSLITDPKGEGSTRSQNAFSYGAGLRLSLGERFGLRGEVKRYLVKLEDPFDAASSASETIHGTRFGGSLQYAL